MHFVHMLNNHDYSFRFLLPQAGTPRSRHEVTTQFATCARKYHDMTLVVNQQRAHAPKQMSSPRFSLPRNVRLVVGSTAKLHTAPISNLTPCTHTSHYDRRVIFSLPDYTSPLEANAIKSQMFNANVLFGSADAHMSELLSG